MWANGLGGQAASAMGAMSAKAKAASALKQAPKSGIQGARMTKARKGRPSRRSVESNEDPPRNVVGAVPHDRPQNGAPKVVGAVPHDRYDGPKVVGAVPHDRNDGPKVVGAVPHDRNDGPKVVGAVPHDSSSYDPWQDNSGYGANNAGATPNSDWWQWFRGWGFGKAKREVGRIVTPNRITIDGHKFNVEAMSEELRAEMFEALYSHTQFEDLAPEMLAFEMEE
jgi:hypothetical protein